MGKHSVIAAGHICLDITPVFPGEKKVARVDELLVPGKLVEMNAASVHTGGSVANTGLALKLLGNDVTLLGKVGDDAFGAMIAEILARYGAGGLIVDKESTTSYSVVLALPGIDRMFLHHPGANNTFSASDVPEEALEQAALFHFGYPPLMKRIYANNGEELKQIMRRAKEKGLVTSLDMAAIDANGDGGRVDWEKLLKNVLPFVDFFVPSFEELCFMLNRPLFYRLTASGEDCTDGLDVMQYAMPLAEKCLEMGCAVAMVKCGLSGLVWKCAGPERMESTGVKWTADKALWAGSCGHQPCYQADTVRSSTGAGDVTIAAWLTAALNGETPEDCARLAAAEGAASVTSYDALGGLMTMEQLKEKLKNGWRTHAGK